MQSEPGVFAKFHYQPKLNGIKSREAGRPVYDDAVYIEIAIAGQDKQVVNRPAQQADKDRFVHEWVAFERGEVSRRTGTPLGQWLRLAQQPGLVKSLELANVFTVEDVAAISDGNINVLGMGGYKLRDEAKAFLSGTSNEARIQEAETLKAENDALKARLAALESQMSLLTERRKPGRPKKEAVQCLS